MNRTNTPLARSLSLSISRFFPSQRPLLLLNFGGRMSIESISQQSSSFVPVVDRIKFTATSSPVPPISIVPADEDGISRAVKYPRNPSGEKSALSMITLSCENNAALSSEDDNRNSRYWDGVNMPDSSCSDINDPGLE